MAAKATNSLERATDILDLIAETSRGLTNAEISRHLRIPPSTCTYILSRLEQKGYCQRDESNGRYEIGVSVIALAHSALHNLGFRPHVELALHKLVADTGCSALIGALKRGRLIILDKVERPELANLDLEIGVRFPPHTTALGKVLLSYLPTPQVLEIVNARGVVKKTPRNPVCVPRLMEELQVVWSQGYAINDEELWAGIYAVAAPIIDGSGNAIAAVSAAGTRARASNAGIITAVRTTAREISKRFISTALGSKLLLQGDSASSWPDSARKSGAGPQEKENED
jgi:DNA-binding IclR family transcriptional regulator